MFRKKISLLILFVIVLNTSLLLFKSSVASQTQDTDFSGSQKESYQCFDQGGDISDVPDSAPKDHSGYWLCNCEDGSSPDPVTFKCPSDGPGCHPLNKPTEPGRPGDPGCFGVRSVLKPPKLQQIEIWFARILYIVWALVGALSFFYLIFLGYQYMITRGDVTKVTAIRQKIIYYIIGFVIVFLAVPVLSTFFRLLGINRDVDCYNVDMPGFQFFFTDLCTDPNDSLVVDPCQVIREEFADTTATTAVADRVKDRMDRIEGTVCTNPGESRSCSIPLIVNFSFDCTSGMIWEYHITGGPLWNLFQ